MLPPPRSIAIALVLAIACLAPTTRAQTIISGPFPFTIAANSTYASGVLLNNSALVSVSNGVVVNASGGTYLDSGVLQIGNATWNSGSTFTVAAGGTVTTSSGTQITATTVNLYGPLLLSGTLTASQINRQDTGGSLSLNGAVLVATGNQSAFLNGFSGGALDLASNSAINTGPYSVTVSSIFTGAGRLLKSGSGTLTLSAVNLHAGGATVSDGILRYGVAAALPILAAVTIDRTGTLDLQAFPTFLGGLAGSGTLQFQNTLTLLQNNADASFAGALTGAGTLIKDGTGTLTLSGLSTHTGGTTLSSGTLTYGRANALPVAGAVAVASGATLNLGGFAGELRSLTGSGSVTLGGGNLTLGGANSSVTFDGPITSGFVTKTGTGTLTLTQGTYTGANFNLGGGTLTFPSAATTGNIVVAGNLTFASSATTGDVTVNGGTALFSGPANLTALSLNTGTTTLASASSVGTLLLQAGTVNLGGATHAVGDLGYTTGTLQNGTVNVTTGAFLGGSLTLSGSTPLVQFGSGAALTVQSPNAASVLTVTGGTQASASLKIGNATSTLGVLTLNNGTWNNSGDTSVGAAGTGTLNLNGSTFTTGSLSLTSSGGLAMANVDSSTLVAGSISRNPASNAARGLLSFNGSTLRASADTAAFLTGFTGSQAQIGTSDLTLDTQGFSVGLPSTLSGGGGLLKTGSGTLTLLAPQTFTGGLTVSAGTLVFGANSSLNSDLINNATVIFDRTDSLSYSGISGTGSVVKNGSGTLTYFGPNTYTGGTTVNAGTLAITANNALIHPTADLAVNGTGTFQLTAGTASAAKVTLGLGGGSGTLLLNGGRLDTGTIERWSGASTATFDGGTLRVLGGDQPAFLNGFTAGSAVIGTNGLAIDTQAFAVTIPSELSGTGSLIKSGSGSLTLSGTNTFAGNLTISAGTLRLGSGGTAGSITSPAILNNGTLQFDRADATTLTAAISGSGSLQKNGAGTLTLSGTNTYIGLTALNAGTLEFGAAGAASAPSTYALAGGTTLSLGGFAATIGALTGSGQVALGNATLTTGGNHANTTFTGAFTGTGGLTKAGAGTFTLQATGLSGPVSLIGGTLALAADLSAAPFTVATGTTLSGTGSVGSLAGTGTFAPGSGGITVGALGTSTTFSGTFAGTGALEKVGAGTLTLSASGLLTGGANAKAGTLAFSTANLALGSALRLGFGGTGSASVTNSTLTLPTVERWSVASSLTLDGATLRATGPQPSFINGFNDGSAVIGSGGLTIDTNGYSVGLSANTVLTGPGGLTKTGGGFLSLSADHTYTGTTTVAAGSLTLLGARSSGTYTLTGGTLDLGGFAHTFGSLTLAGGAFTNGSLSTGTLALSSGSLASPLTVTAVVNATGTFTVSSGGNVTATAAPLLVEKSGGTASLSVAGGTLAVASAAVGVTSGTAGSLSLSAGTFSASGNLSVGNAGTGALAVSGGSASVDKLLLGYGGGTGSLSLTGGTLTLASLERWSSPSTASFNGGTLRAAANASTWIAGFTTGSAVIGASGLTLDTNGFAVGVPTEFSGPGGLTKSGTGTLTLSGASTFTGPIAISAGSLVLDPSAALTLANSFSGSGALRKTGSATLTLTGSSLAVGSLDLAAGTLALTGAAASFGSLAGSGALSLAGTTINVGSAATSTTFSGSLTGSGHLNKTGSGNLTLTGAHSLTGTTTIYGGTLTLADGASLSGPLVNSTALVVDRATDLTLSGSLTGPGNLTKAGASTLTLSANNLSAGFVNVSAGTLALSGDTASFGSLSGGGTLALGGTALTVGSDNLSTTLTGVVSGTGSLTKLGTGALTLTGNVALPGGIVINGGTLALGGASASLGSLAGSGALTLASTALTLGSANTSSTFSGALSSSGSLTKVGTGTLTLASTSTFNGGTTISGGTLELAPGGSLSHPSSELVLASTGSGSLITGAGSALFASKLILGHDGGTATAAFGAGTVTTTAIERWSVPSTISFDGTTLRAAAAAPGLLAGFGAGTAVIGGNGLTIDTNGVDATVSSSLSGFGALTKTGTGTLTLSGTNTYTVGSNLENGTTVIPTGGSLTHPAAMLLVGRLGGAATVDITGGNLITGIGGIGYFGGFTGTVNLSAGSWQSSTLEIGWLGVGTLRLTGGTATTGATRLGAIGGSGNLVLNGGVLATTQVRRYSGLGGLTAGGGTLRATADNTSFITGFAAGTAVLNPGGLTVDTNGFSVTADAPFSGTGGLTKIGLGTLTLSGANTYSGDTNVNVGTLRLGTASALSPNSTLHVAPGATFDPNGYAPTLANLSGTGSIDTGTGGLGVAPSGTNTFTGTLTGSGGLTMSGTGTLELAHANTFSGATTISSGTVKLAATGALPSGTPLTLSTGATLNLNGHAASLGKLDGSGNIVLGSANLTVAQASNSAFTGGISGTGGLTKSGSGKLTLSGTHTYSGATAITGGQLALTGSASASTFSVDSGGTLSGTGTLGALTVNTGGTISPGASPGTLTTGATVFNSGGSLVWEINNATGTAGTNWDLLSISGSLTVASTSGSPFAINLTSLLANNSPGNVINFNSALNSSYTLATASGGIVGFSADKFSLNTSGFTNPLNGGAFSLSTSGNNLNLNFTASAIPEPSTYAALFGVSALALALHRRKTRSRSA